MSDQKNLLLAIVASILIMVSFQYFWESPKIEAEQARQQEAAQSTTPARGQPQASKTEPGQIPAPGPVVQPKADPDTRLPAASSTTPGAASSRSLAPGGPVRAVTGPVIKGPRITLESRHLLGSISLKGGQIDDITLKSYRQTTDPASPAIRLLAPK